MRLRFGRHSLLRGLGPVGESQGPSQFRRGEGALQRRGPRADLQPLAAGAKQDGSAGGDLLMSLWSVANSQCRQPWGMSWCSSCTVAAGWMEGAAAHANLLGVMCRLAAADLGATRIPVNRRRRRRGPCRSPAIEPLRAAALKLQVVLSEELTPSTILNSSAQSRASSAAKRFYGM
jgi:hypothetical protein